MQTRYLPRPHQAGFTLTELAIVLVIISLIIGLFAGASVTLINNQRASVSRTRLSAIDISFALFVAQNKRLPCPADGSLAPGDANAGIEMAHDSTGCTASQANGVVPWVTLGISATDAEDGWGNRFTYRLPVDLAAPLAMDMSTCDPAGTSATATLLNGKNTCNSGSTCTSTALSSCVPPNLFLTAKGLKIQTAAAGGTVLMDPAANPPNGAAYVVISHGENGAGARSNQGVFISTSGQGTNEAPNNSDGALGTYYVDTPLNYTNDTSRFDDFVSRPSVFAVISRAQLGPRNHP